MREKYNFSFANKKVIDKMAEESYFSRNAIQNIPWYNILSNPLYADDFSYVPVNTPNRELMVRSRDSNESGCEQSDMVALMVYLGYISHAKDFKCEPGFARKFGQAM